MMPIIRGSLLLLVATTANAQLRQSQEHALLTRAMRHQSTDKAATQAELNEVLLGKGCSFCVNINFKANFDKLATAIAGVASEVKDVESTLARMSANLTHALQDIADGIESLAKSISALGADMLLHLVAMKGFLNTVMAEIDLTILVQELQMSIARVSHRQTLLEPLYKDKSALSPEDKASLITAVLSINEGSALDTEIIHDVLTGTGGVVPGVKPALSVYIEKGYRLKDLAKVYGALFVYQMHGYGQLFWAYMNQQPDVMLLDYNKTMALSADRMLTQWVQFAAPNMWHCYWDDGFQCPEYQRCHANLRQVNFTCNYAEAPVTMAADTVAADNAFNLGAASSQSHLKLHIDATTGTCVLGVEDCTGAISAPVPIDGAAATNWTCTAAANIALSETGLFTVNNGTFAHVLANLTTSGMAKHALHVNESGGIEIVGNDSIVEWAHPPPPLPASGPCPTDFSFRQLRQITYDSCSCITTARWRKVAADNVNVTASWCGRLCQADPQYVAAAPRADGECWCGTADVLMETMAQQDNCNASCPYCPGAPVEGCGNQNFVAIYTWGSSEDAHAADETQSMLVV